MENEISQEILKQAGKDYLNALDYMYGILHDFKNVKQDDAPEIIRKGNEASEVLFGKVGKEETLTLSPEKATELRKNGPENFGTLFGNYKEGVSYGLGIITSENGETVKTKLRLHDEASKAIFGENIKKITFA